MSSRDIHYSEGGKKVRDFLSSLLSSLLLKQKHEKPIYLISPWISDFLVFDNKLGQFRDLFRNCPETGEEPEIKFSDILLEISANFLIRIITYDNNVRTQKIFLEKIAGRNKIEIRKELNRLDHQKAFLSELFYFEGSMNFTYSGVYKNKEKITCNHAKDKDGQKKITEAYLEFDRSWENLTEAQNNH
jgi:hypothetical protein